MEIVEINNRGKILENTCLCPVWNKKGSDIEMHSMCFESTNDALIFAIVLCNNENMFLQELTNTLLI